MKKQGMYLFLLINFCVSASNNQLQVVYNCPSDDKNQIETTWRFFRGYLYVILAGLLHNRISSHPHLEFARTAFIGGLGMKGCLHILKVLTDEARENNNIDTQDHQKITHFLNVFYTASIISIGGGLMGFYPCLSDVQKEAFWNSIITAGMIYLGGNIAYHIFDKQA